MVGISGFINSFHRGNKVEFLLIFIGVTKLLFFFHCFYRGSKVNSLIFIGVAKSIFSYFYRGNKFDFPVFSSGNQCQFLIVFIG